MNSRRYIGVKRIHWDATDSTNFRAAELALDPANAGVVITADLQSQGHGQHGRVWQSSPETNVLLSALLFPPPELRRPVILTAFAAMAVAETIFQVIGLTAAIKWPNDLLIDRKKVCGILIEGGKRTGGASEAGSYFVVGIGLNVNQSVADFEQMELPDASSLSVAVGKKLDVQLITNCLIDNLDEQYSELLDGQFTKLESDWAKRIGKLGRAVTVELADRNEVQGQLQALTFDNLILELPSGEQRQIRPEMVRHIR